MRRGAALLLLAATLSACGGASTPAFPAASAPTYSGTVLADGPAAYWRMGEASGTMMTDATKNQNNGTYLGKVSLGQPGALAGDAGTAAVFDGASGAATVPNSPSLQVNWVTIELWVKKLSEAGYGIYVAKNVAGSGGVGSSWFQLLNNSFSGQLEFRVTGDTGPTLVSSAVLTLNTWYYVVASYDGTVAKLYINGKLDNSLPVVAAPAQSADPLYIARRADGFFNNVVLQEVAIYPVALSADRIATHWQIGSNTH